MGSNPSIRPPKRRISINTDTDTVVILNGPPSSGKDTIADLLVDRLGKDCHHLRFKTSLYKIVQAIHGISDKRLEELKLIKEYPQKDLGMFSFREVLIHVSENIIKPNYGINYFGVTAAKSLKFGLNIFSDGGFIDEVDEITNKVGTSNVLLIRLHRKGTNYNIDSRSYLYPTNIASVDLHNDGTIEDTLEIVLEVLEEVGFI